MKTCSTCVRFFPFFFEKLHLICIRRGHENCGDGRQHKKLRILPSLQPTRLYEHNNNIHRDFRAGRLRPFSARIPDVLNASTYTVTTLHFTDSVTDTPGGGKGRVTERRWDSNPQPRTEYLLRKAASASAPNHSATRPSTNTVNRVQGHPSAQRKPVYSNYTFKVQGTPAFKVTPDTITIPI